MPDGVARANGLWSLWGGVRGLPRALWFLYAAVLINRAGTMVVAFLVLYLTGHAGVPATAAASLLAIYGAGSLAGGVIAGRLCDRYGAIRVLTGALVASAMMLLAYPLVRAAPAIAGLTFVLALTSEAFRPASLSVIAEITPAEKRKAAYAVNRVAINLGWAIGGASGGVLADLWFPAIFVVDGGTSLLAALVIIGSSLRYGGRAIDSHGRQAGERRAPVRTALTDARLLLLLSGTLLVSVVFFQFTSSMTLYLVRDVGLSKSMVGALVAINAILVVLVEVPLNEATARWPLPRSLSIGAVLVGLGFGALVLANGPASVVATIVVWTFGEMLYSPAALATVVALAPEGRTGAYMGLYSTTFGLAMVIGPWLGIMMLERLGSTALWGGAFGVGIAAALLLHLAAARVPAAQGELV